MLIAAVVGSGIMAEHLAAGNAAIALLANTFATVAASVGPHRVVAPISGAHLNPAISLVSPCDGNCRGRLARYVLMQLIGAIAESG